LPSKELTSALAGLLKSEDEGVRRRASWMLEHVEAV
jgi:HEAT repeat protein